MWVSSSSSKNFPAVVFVLCCLICGTCGFFRYWIDLRACGSSLPLLWREIVPFLPRVVRKSFFNSETYLFCNFLSCGIPFLRSDLVMKISQQFPFSVRSFSWSFVLVLVSSILADWWKPRYLHVSFRSWVLIISLAWVISGICCWTHFLIAWVLHFSTPNVTGKLFC